MSENGKPNPYTTEEFCAASRATVDLRRVRETLGQRDDLRAALLALRDTDQESEDETRTVGPCWCPAWLNTKTGGHTADCLQARKALGVL